MRSIEKQQIIFGTGTGRIRNYDRVHDNGCCIRSHKLQKAVMFVYDGIIYWSLSHWCTLIPGTVLEMWISC